MPNHVHLVAVPVAASSLARALGRTHAEYARYFNIQRLSCGHVWQARYFSCPLDDRHRWATAHVESNPGRAGLVEEPSQWRWSSARAHLQERNSDNLLDLAAWCEQYTSERWRQVLATSIFEEALLERLREATVRARPAGTGEFVEELERRVRRTLHPGRPGRPMKQQGNRGDVDAGDQQELEIGI